jgi:hypothetical protein
MADIRATYGDRTVFGYDEVIVQDELGKWSMVRRVVRPSVCRPKQVHYEGQRLLSQHTNQVLPPTIELGVNRLDDEHAHLD